MFEDIIQAADETGRRERMPNRIHFCTIHKESTLSDLYADNDSQDNNRCASDKDWKMPEIREEDLKKIEFDNDVDNDEIKDLNNQDKLHLNDNLANNKNNDIDDIGAINKHDDQHDHFGVPDDNLQQQNQYFRKKEQHDLNAADEDDDNNSHVNLVGDEEMRSWVLIITITSLMIVNNMTLTLIIILTVNLIPI